jgi:transmembrane sensor
MSSDRSNEESIAATAAQWLARHDRGLRPEEQVEFDVWLAGEPRHAAAYDRICAGWDQCENAKKIPELVRLAQALDEQTRPRPVRAAWPWRPALGLAAAAGLVVFLGLWQRRAPAPPPAQAVAANYRVIPTTVQRLVLEDGSVAELRGNDSAIKTEFTAAERRVLLLRGEAYFEVAKNPDRPFVVAAGRIAVRATGTAFNVQLNNTDLAVVVTEGRVTVVAEPGAKPDTPTVGSLAPLLAAGQRALLARETPTRAPMLLKVDALTAGELADVLAWQATWLVFDETPLEDTIEAFNRHGSHHVVVGDAALRARRLTGKFRTDNIEGLLRLLEFTMNVKVERRADGKIVLVSK